ncbi:MAG: DUF3488 domain-containing transglutaminase family protein [Thiotrichales bacterium]|nr:MAG: DUF3488 domain-containing transglutaminase family protein [Thiotrichales bacterium]
MSADRLTKPIAPLLLGIHVVALPLYPHMPVMVLLLTAAFTVWALLIINGKAARPGRWALAVMTVLVVVVLMLSFGTILGQLPGSAMLLLLAFLKLFEMKSTRDIAIVIFMGFFLVASKFFYSQSLLIAAHVFVVVVYLTSLLIVFSDRLGTMRLQARLHQSFRMIAQAVPLMLILFVLFPRMPGPLWGLPRDAGSATSGLSEEMSPGSINRLIASGEVAFRVQFDSEPPPRSDLYWRGLALSSYDGRTWRMENAPAFARPLIVSEDVVETIYSYTVMLEPHNQHWLYALELPIQHDRSLLATREMHLVAASPVTDVLNYQLRSDIGAENGGLFEPERRKNLALPEGLNQDTAEFASKLFIESNRDSNAYINNVLRYFSNEAFSYTLSPPLLGEHAMDDFLFSTRRGFCEHFASAFVYLMRSAGIPSRVVVGYQGGAMHPFDDYMIVRQSDAHAWAEVWLEDEGWVRVDPTAAVSPTRIERGIENAGLEHDLLPAILISDNVVFQRARYMLDSFRNSWNQWIVGFNSDRQKELLRLLGFNNVTSSNLLMGLVLLMTVAGSLVAWWVIHREPVRRRDEIKLYYEKFCSKLEKVGIRHRSNEGATEFLSRVMQLLPSKRRELAMITDDYERLRYSCDNSEALLKRYIRAVRRFKPK